MEDDVREEYKSSLADLNCNSKPHINCLTMIAGDNVEHASQIVDVIVNHVKTVSPELKLPCLYLVDSIVKNIGQDYLNLFSEKIVTIFSTVFEKVDEKTRILLYRLRQTWSEIFPNKILYAIDVCVKQLDPAWPVTAQPPAQSIHINPKFLGNTPKKPGVPPMLDKRETNFKVQQQEALKHILAKEQLRNLDQKKAEMAKKHSSSTPNPVVLHLQPSQPQPVQVASFQSLCQQHNPQMPVRRSFPNSKESKTKLDPRISQRDPRLMKSIGSTANKVQHDIKSQNLSSGVKSLSETSSKQSALSSVVLVPGTAVSKAPEIISHASLPRSGPKCDKSQDILKDKTRTKDHPPEKENMPNHLSIETTKLNKRNPFLKKPENEPGMKRSPEKPGTDKTLPPKNRQNTSPNKEKNIEKQKPKTNENKKSPAKNKNSENKKLDSKSAAENNLISEKSKKDNLGSKAVVGNEDSSTPTLRVTRSQNKLDTFDSKRSSLHQRSRPSPPSIPKKRESVKARKSFQNQVKSKVDDHVERNSKLAENTSSPQSNSSLVVGDTDLRIKNSVTANSELADKIKSGKREQSCFEENANQENILVEPPEKKAKLEDEDHSDSVSLFGTEDQDYRHKDREDNQHLGWAQYKVFHPDEYKSPFRPARENMENNGPDGFRGNNENLHSKHPTPGRYDPYRDPQTIGLDRFGRPRLNRRREQRYQNHFLKRYSRFENHTSDMFNELQHARTVRNQITDVFSDPKMILRETEKKFRDGIISQEEFFEISSSLRQMWSSKSFETWAPSYYPPDHRFSDHSNEVFHAHQTRPPSSSFHELGDPTLHNANIQGPLVSTPPETSNSVEIDKKSRIIHFIDDKAIVLMDNNDPRELTFKGPPTQVTIEGLKPFTLGFDGKPVEFELNGKKYSMKFGAPSREIYINNYPYAARFGGSFRAQLDDKTYTIKIGLPRPQVQVGEESQHQLYQKFLAQNSGVVRNNSHAVENSQELRKVSDVCYNEPQDTDLRNSQNDNLLSGSVPVDSGDVDMRTEEGHTDSNELEYEAASGMKDVDWRQAASSGNYDQLPRSKSESISTSEYSPNYVNEGVTVRPLDPQFESTPQLSPQRRQTVNPEIEHSTGKTCLEGPPKIAQSNWCEQGLESSENWRNNERHYNNWETNQDKNQDWPKTFPRFGQPPDQPLNRTSLHPDYWQDSKLLKPPYPAMESGEPFQQNQQQDISLPQNHGKVSPWQVPPNQPPPPLLGQVRPTFENWEWKHKGYMENVSRPPMSMIPPSQNYPHNIQRSEQSYGALYEAKLMRPPLRQMGHQMRPVFRPRLRPNMSREELFRQRPPAPGHRHWPPRIRPGGMPPHNLNLRRLALPPPPLPPASMCAHVNPVTRVPLLRPNIAAGVPSVPDQKVQITPELPSTLNSTSVIPSSTSETIDSTASDIPGVSVALPVEMDPDSSSGTVSNAFSSLDISVDVASLFDKLVAAGIISTPAVSVDEVKPVPEIKNIKEEKLDEGEAIKDDDKISQEESVPPIDLSSENLKCRYPAVINALVRGSQCASCGMRFKDTRSEHYSRHLDWHFRVNRREKDGAKKAFSRKWYYDVEDWIQFEEFEDFEERTRSFFELQADEEQFQMVPPVEIPSVAACGQETEVCVVCGEAFQLFWGEEEEEWHLKDAVRHDGQPYHPLCYEDFVKASKIPETPTDDVVDSVSDIKTEKTEEEEKEVQPDEGEKSPVLSAADSEIVIKTEPSTDEVGELPAMEIETVAIKTEKEDEVSVKNEVASSTTEELTVGSLEGKPGEEEIIGVITESDLEVEIEEPRKESKMVVLQSGGIVMKVRAASIQPASPAPTNAFEKDSSKELEAESEEDELPLPTPDPRFQVLPVVKKGNELSGLCCIM